MSKQTRRVYKNNSNLEAGEVEKWIEYFHHCHRKGRHEIARTALVTTFSLVLFSCVLGIETKRMASHSRPSMEEIVAVLTDDSILPHVDSNKSDTTTMKNQAGALETKGVDEKLLQAKAKEIKHLFHPLEPAYESFLLALAAALCATMLGISALNLWSETRSCLVEEDAMDRFANASEALGSIRDSRYPG